MGRKEDVYLITLLFLALDLDIKEIDNPREYIIEHFDDLVTENVIDYVKNNIHIIVQGQKENYRDIISYLLLQYAIKTNEDDMIVKYLNSVDVHEAINLFESNEQFSSMIIRTYYKNLDKSLNNDGFYALTSKYDPEFEIKYLPEIIRESFITVYGFFTNLAGFPMSPAEAIISVMYDLAKFAGNEEIERASMIIRNYRDYLPRLIYSDVYESLVVDGKIDSDEIMLVKTVKSACASGDYDFPKNLKDFNTLLNYFNYLALSPEKRSRNRRRLSKQYMDKIKNINPLWMLDESEFVIKR